MTQKFDLDDSDQQKLDEWDPDRARIKGTLKSVIEFKTGDIEVDIKVEFSDPKAYVQENKKAKVVHIGKRNKNALF